MQHYLSHIQDEIVTFEIKSNSLGVLFKFLLFFLGGIYLLRLLSPFLFKWMISSFIKRNNYPPQAQPTSKAKNKPTSDSLGEYIDYEEVD